MKSNNVSHKLTGALLVLALTTFVSNAFALNDKMAFSSAHTIFVDNGYVFGMGDNSFAQIIPNATVVASNLSSTFRVPTTTTITNAKSVAASTLRSAALLNDGTVKVWGRTIVGTASKAGIATTYSMAGGISDIALSATKLYFIANGIVYKNAFTTTSTAITTSAQGKATSVAAGLDYVIVLFSDGTIGTAGMNGFGQLGNSSTSTVEQVNVAKVAGVSGVKSIATGDYTAYVVKTNGTVMGWGKNNHSQIGLNNITTILTPTAVPDLTGVIKVAANSMSALALMPNGTVLGAGFHDIISGSVYNISKTFTDLTFTNVTNVYSGGQQSFVDMNNAAGTLRGWCGNNVGMLGDGTITERHAPTYSYFTPIAAQVAVPEPNSGVGLNPFGKVTPPAPVAPVVVAPVESEHADSSTHKCTINGVLRYQNAPCPVVAPVVVVPVVTAPLLYCSMNACLKDGKKAQACQALIAPTNRGNNNCKS